MPKYYCPSCGGEVTVTRPNYSNEVVVTCNSCMINARGFDDKVLDIFHTAMDRIKVDCRVRFMKSFAKKQEDIAMDYFEYGVKSVVDQDYKQTRFSF